MRHYMLSPSLSIAKSLILLFFFIFFQKKYRILFWPKIHLSFFPNLSSPGFAAEERHTRRVEDIGQKTEQEKKEKLHFVIKKSTQKKAPPPQPSLFSSY